MSKKRVKIEELQKFCKEALVKYGMSERDAALTGEVLSVTDAFGINSHGTKNLRMYIEKIKAGGLNPKAEPEFIREGGAFAVLDGKDGMGMVNGRLGMEKAIELAQKSGIGYVSVKNSCHFGAGAYYANFAAQKGLLGIAMSNTDPNMAVPGGKSMILGNNPFAFAYPVKGSHPVILDIALSATAALKINKAKMYHQSIPDTWMVDPDGKPTTDPQYYQNGGALQPMGAHKGYGLSMMVEALSALVSGGYLCRDVKSWCFDLPSHNRVSHAFIAVDLAAVCPDGNFAERAKEYVDYIQSSPKAKGNDHLFVPGEMEWNRYDSGCKDGILLPEDVVDSIEKLSEEDPALKIAWSGINE